MTSSIKARSTGTFLAIRSRVGPEFTAAAGLLHLRRVTDEMDLRIRPFEHEVVASGLFVLTVNQDPALDRCHLRRIEHFDRQALIGHDDSVRRERSLAVSRSLHCPENLFKIVAHSPGVRSRRFCQAHSPEHCEARGLMLCVKAGRIGQTCLHRIPRDSEVLRFCVRADSRRVLKKPAIKRREPRLSDFAPFCLHRIEFRPVPELARAQVLGDFPQIRFGTTMFRIERTLTRHRLQEIASFIAEARAATA